VAFACVFAVVLDPGGFEPGDFDSAGFGLFVGKGLAHWPQNLKLPGFSAWQLGHTRFNAAAHWPQNFIPSGLSNPHFRQCITVPLGLLVF